MTHNLCVDIHRERSRGANRVEDIEVYASSEEQELVRSDDTPESALETEEKRIVIRRAIANLPTRLRETFILHFYQELPYLEIAQQQEICYQNVCKRISQARKILREELKGYFIGEEGMDKSVPPTATESAIGEMSQGNAPVEPTVGETVTLSVAVEEVESVGDSEAIEAVRDVQHSDSVMVAATCEEKLEVRSGSCRCVEATLCERQFAPILANAQFDEKTGRWGNSCLAALRKQQHQVKKKWREFVRSSRSPPSGIAADSAHASPLYSLPLPQPDPPTLQKPLTRLPLTSQPSPLPIPTPPEAFPKQGGSLDTATANRRGRFDGETPRRRESYEFLHRSDESPAPGLP